MDFNNEFVTWRDKFNRRLVDDRLPAVLDQLVSEPERLRYESARQRLREDEFLVAVIGRQGVGKSSLMNALLFGERVLPIDETETTNVICRLRAADKDGERAEVHFQDERAPDVGELSDEFLRQYTDEQENPANEKGVKDVIGYCRSPLLDTGITLADTPGVGSLTPTAGRVTYDFLPRISLGIFLISTTPPLIASEMAFLRATWAYSRHFVFVQNVWGEADTQIQLATEDIYKKLKAIAQEAGEADISLQVVNVNEGLEGACNDQPERVETSGLGGLIRELMHRLESGAGRTLVLTNGGAIVQILGGALKGAEVRIQSLHARNAETQEAFEVRLQEAIEELKNLNGEWEQAKSRFHHEKDEVFTRFREDLSKAITDAEEQVIALAKARKIDAKRLESTAQDIFLQAVRRSTDQLEQHYVMVVRNFVDRAQQLMLELSNLSAHTTFSFDVSMHEAASTAAGVLSGLGGLALSVMVGVGITAAIGVIGEGVAAAFAVGAAALSTIPIVGWVAAGAVVAVGFGAKHLLDQETIKTIEREVRKAGQNIRQKVETEVPEKLDAHARNEVMRQLEEQFQAGKAQQAQVLEALAEDRQRGEAEVVALLAALAGQRDLLRDALTDLLVILKEVESKTEPKAVTT